jgi:hypothetical protein
MELERQPVVGLDALDGRVEEPLLLFDVEGEPGAEVGDERLFVLEEGRNVQVAESVA